MVMSIRRSIVAIALTSALAACAGGPAASGVATLEDPAASVSPAPSAASTDPQDALLAYAGCMRENGIPMTDPRLVEGRGVGFGLDADATTVDKATFKDADTTCRPHLANVVQEQSGPGLSPEDEERLLQFARCMRDHGVNMPDPLPPGTVIDEQSGSGGKPDPNDPDVAAARAACNGGLPDKVPVGGAGKPGSVSNP